MARRRDDDEDDDDLPKKKRTPARSEVEDDEDDDFDDGPPPKKKSKEDAFTGLAAISLVALIIAAVMLYLDTSELGTAAPPQPSVNVPGLGAGPAANTGL